MATLEFSTEMGRDKRIEPIWSVDPVRKDRLPFGDPNDLLDRLVGIEFHGEPDDLVVGVVDGSISFKDLVDWFDECIVRA